MNTLTEIRAYLNHKPKKNRIIKNLTKDSGKSQKNNPYEK